MKIRVLSTLIGLIFAVFLSLGVQAHEPDAGLPHLAPPVSQSVSPGMTITNTQFDSTAIAIAASQANFDPDARPLQMSVGVANYNNTNALSFSLAKRLCRWGLVSGTYAGARGHHAVGVGMTFFVK